MDFFFPVFLSRAARVANSNTSRTPSLVLAEHSRYLAALMLLATVCPCGPHCQLAVFPTPLRARGFSRLPAPGSRAAGWSCGAPRSSSGRSEDPSCIRQGSWGRQGRNDVLPSTTGKESRVSKMGRDVQHTVSEMGLTFSPTLSRESGESTAKQIRMTCESGYDRGRRRS